MGRYLGPICRLCRREGIKLCDKHKCATLRRNYPPGQSGQTSQGKPSDYAKQLREKQKTRRIYGISEKQLQKYYEKAMASPLVSGEELIRQLEHRLDNAVFRSGFASTRRQARQFVSHGIFLLNGRRATVPSMHLKQGDRFEVRQQRKGISVFENFEKRKLQIPSWLKIDQGQLAAEVITKAQKADFEQAVNPQMIIEFYSR